jgi:ubiquinone/menaquinone biosynthesis C-methylase UbiE
MESFEPKNPGSGCSDKEHDTVFDYLCVDRYLTDMMHTQALSTAFESGLIDALVKACRVSVESLTDIGSVSSRGMRFLLNILRENGVIEEQNGMIALTAEFSHALDYRDLMKLKSSLARLAAHDLLDHFPDFVFHPDRFSQKARYFRLFSYDRCFIPSPENEAAAKQWMHITTTLTKYEAPVCLKLYDFSGHSNMLDIGGNSGEFALRICKRNPKMKAAVFDLPLVCQIGRKHIEREPEADRISFIEGNALTDVLHEGFDLITFKSMLHDWPEKEARQFIENASCSLSPGGALLIFERGPIESTVKNLSYSMIPILMFSHSFRSPSIYERYLQELNFRDITITQTCLDSPFFMITGKKKLTP